MMMSSNGPVLHELKSNEVKYLSSNSEFSIGRSVNSSFDIPSPFISRNQCKIVQIKKDQWAIYELSSFKTTLVNDCPISEDYSILKNGDRITFSNYREVELVFYTDAHNLPMGGQKRKINEVYEESSVIVVSPTLSTQLNDSRLILRGEHFDRDKFEIEGSALRERLDYYKRLAENAQKSLSSYSVENKSLRDRLREEEKSRKLLENEFQELREQLKENELEQERLIEECKCKARPASQKDSSHCDNVGGCDSEDDGDVLNHCQIGKEPTSDVNFCSLETEPNFEASKEAEDFFSSILKASFQEKDKISQDIMKSTDLHNVIVGVEMAYMTGTINDLKLELAEKEKIVASALEEKDLFRASFTQALEHELLCSVCNEILYEPTTLNCKHTFCKACVTEWKKKKKECPICRSKIKAEVQSLVMDSYIDKMADILGGDFQKRRNELKLERIQSKSPKTTRTPRSKTTRRARMNAPGLQRYGNMGIISLASLVPIETIEINDSVVEADVEEVVDLTAPSRRRAVRRRHGINCITAQSR